MVRHAQPDIIADVQRTLNISEAMAKAAVVATLGSIRQALLRWDDVSLPRIGRLRVVHYHRRTTHLPPGKRGTRARKDRLVTVPAYERVTFRPSDWIKRELRDAHGKR